VPGALADGLAFHLPVSLHWWLRSHSSSAQESALHRAQTAEDSGGGAEVPEQEELELCKC